MALVVLAAPVPPGAAGTGTPSFWHYAAPTGLAYANDAANPTIGVDWSTNAVMYQAYVATYRIAFDDSVTPPTATWTNVRPLANVVATGTVVHTDPVTGRTWVGSLAGACTTHAYRDGGGAWTQGGTACVGTDSPSLASGPATAGSLSPRVLYSCAQGAAAIQCARSDDGGLTFRPTGAMQCGHVNPGLGGDVHVGFDRAVYVPYGGCGAVAGVAVSTNGGLTWTGRPIPGAAAPASGFAPDVATTPSGRAWVAYPTGGNGVGVARTDNHGATWTSFGDVAAAAGIRSSAFHEMVAGDDNRAAVVYLGSTTDGDPHASSFSGVWHAYETVTYDGGATWTTVKTGDNVIQRGWICADGTGCSSGRNLMEGMDAEVDGHGRVVIGLADGCTGSCETGGGASTSARATLVRQSGGATLFSLYD